MSAKQIIDLTQTIDCPICMDCIVSENNKVTTECGHCFHTNCLMANVAHNGFGCPYCRSMMAEEPEEDDDETISVISVDSNNSLITENEYNSRMALRSIRYLFQEAGDEEEDEEREDEDEDEDEEREDEEREQEYPKPPMEFLVQKMIEQGFTFERLLKVCLIEHEEYNDIEEEIQEEEDKIFETLRILISNYSEPIAPTPAVVENKVETSFDNDFMRSSYV
jgi:hypothetical protein